MIDPQKSSTNCLRFITRQIWDKEEIWVSFDWWARQKQKNNKLSVFFYPHSKNFFFKSEKEKGIYSVWMIVCAITNSIGRLENDTWCRVNFNSWDRNSNMLVPLIASTYILDRGEEQVIIH